MSLPNTQNEVYHILYREVRSKDKLEKDRIDENEEVKHIKELLRDVHNNVEYTHTLDGLDVNSYFRDWVDSVLSEVNGLEDHEELDVVQELTYLAEDFSEHMKSRARERGKYVVFILSTDSLIVCHSFTGKKALTTDMDVIEELLSEANIDKYAHFERGSEETIDVKHFDRHDTESFSEWLGIPEDEIAFDVKGSIRVLTKIDGIDAVFEFDQEDISTKILGSDDYDLSDGMLKTSNERPRSVQHVRWGHKTFTDVEEFKQELIKTNFNLQRAFDLYDEEISDNLSSFFTVIDEKDRIIKRKGNDLEAFPKPHVDFELTYVNAQVQMSESWKTELAQKLLSKHDPVPICHAGSEFAERPFPIGNFRTMQLL